MKVFRCRICGEVYIGKDMPASCPFCGAHQNYLLLAREWSLIKAANLSDTSKEYLKKSLDLEINNTNFYRVVSEKSKDIYIQSMFKGFSKVEREHASAICKHLEIEKPDSTAGLDKAVDSDQENMEEAARREKFAVKFYGEAAGRVPEPQIKDFFKALIEIESDHIVLIEQKT